MAAASTDIRVPSECREMIRAGALLAINTSGGKDRAVVRRAILTPQYQATSIAYHADWGGKPRAEQYRLLAA